jgi:CheY-like chemotaxis protein
VLADVGMPDRDGYEVAAFVKGRPDLAHIPVLLLTGAFEPVDEARVREARCEGVLAKPFEPQLLIGRVKELLARRGPGPSTFDEVPTPPPGEDEAALDMHALLDSQPGRSTEADMSLDDYFDRLDQAFASLAGSGATGGSPAPASWSDPTPAPAAVAAAPRPLPPAPPSQALRPVPVADVFASILEAEAAGPASPAAPLSVLVPPPAISDELVERIVRLVIDRMADGEIRQAVAEIVSRTAERLVREEIQRLKAL